jgi:PadR family transcriptional regulator, regulatory protein PadR
MYDHPRDMAFKSDLDALILGVLQEGERHGYEIAKRIRELSETALAVGEGQLYPALHRLERDGLVAATWIPQEGKPPRKVYHLTDEGRGALATHRLEWERFANSVDRILTPGKLKPGANHA